MNSVLRFLFEAMRNLELVNCLEFINMAVSSFLGRVSLGHEVHVAVCVFLAVNILLFG